MCHSLFKSGEFHINSQKVLKSDFEETSNSAIPTCLSQHTDLTQQKHVTHGTLNQLEGILSFIFQVKHQSDERSIGEKLHKPTGIIKLYRDFLFYKHFVVLDCPLIICEGKTDIIYLKCAIERLIDDYILLASKVDDKIIYKTNFFKLTENTKKVFAISGGTPGLLSLMNIYNKNLKRFTNISTKHPVIILVDNDSGFDEIEKLLKKKLHIKSVDKNWYHFTDNLYLAIIPSVSGKAETMIEDLFDDITLSTTVNGKTFNRNDTISKSEYGKIVFAEKVVKANRNTINFNGFKDTLNLFEEVIADYKKVLS